MPHGSYLIFRTVAGVEIIRILHAARDVGALLDDRE